MTSKSISIAADFSPSPAGRYESDGPFPGEVFRERLLGPALRNFDEVVVDLDGTSGYGSSFLEEAFGGLVRGGFTIDQLKKKLKVNSSRESYRIRIWNYIREASQTSRS